MKISAQDLLARSTDALTINFAELIARCAIFPHPDVVALLSQTFAGAVWFPGYRRSRLAQGEPRRGLFKGELLDDNTKANYAIKEAIFDNGHAGCSGFAVCHIWPGTCYDTGCHTALANLVLLPAPLAGLTDHSPEIASLLQSRSYGLYRWLPPDIAIPDPVPDLPWHPFIPPSPQVLRRVARRAVSVPPTLNNPLIPPT